MTCTGCVYLATDGEWCAMRGRVTHGLRCMSYNPKKGE